MGREVESGFIEVDGGRLYYEQAGEGEPLVMIHDGLVHSAGYDSQFAAFSGDYRVVRYDRRGYGRSPVAAEPYSNVSDLKAIFDSLDIGRAMVMGGSAGGRLAIDFTLRYPERVSTLVLVGAVVSGMPYSTHMITRGGHLKASDNASPEAFRSYWYERDPYEMAPNNLEARRKVGALIEANPQNADRTKPHLDVGPERPALGALGEIKVPTLVLVGEYDIPDCHAFAGAIEAGVPDAQRVVVPDAGHLIPIEQPQVFNELVRTFLNEAPFFSTLRSEGVTAAAALFEQRRMQDPQATVFAEARVNAEGYNYLFNGQVDEACELFRLNVEAYPESANVYDSYGEGLLARGDTARAIVNYEKSLTLNPNNNNAAQVLERIRGQQ